MSPAVIDQCWPLGSHVPPELVAFLALLFGFASVLRVIALVMELIYGPVKEDQ